MGERSEFKPGTFSWTDLSTTDQAAAKEFYGELFGWQAEDMPVGDGVSYSMMRQGGKDVAAISPQNAQQRELGLPPAWNSYITVESADAAASRAAELGATVHAPAFDVMDAGRMAVIQDPQGAAFLLWEPRRHIGAALVNAHGALSWNELSVADLDRASDFYKQLFGWELEPFEGSPEPYLTIRNAGAANGGLRSGADSPAPPAWLVYFGVDDLDAALARISGELGGETVAGATDIGIARIAVVRDPQGAMFALYCGALEP